MTTQESGDPATDDDEDGGKTEILSPVEIALHAMQGLLASGQFSDNPAAAGVLAWQCVFGFQDGAQQYARIASAMYGQEEPNV